MSRIGLKPIVIPAGVDVTLDGNTVTVKGPNGTLTMDKAPVIGVKVEGNEINVSRPNDEKRTERFTVLPVRLSTTWLKA